MGSLILIVLLVGVSYTLGRLNGEHAGYTRAYNDIKDVIKRVERTKK